MTRVLGDLPVAGWFFTEAHKLQPRFLTREQLLFLVRHIGAISLRERSAIDCYSPPLELGTPLWPHSVNSHVKSGEPTSFETKEQKTHIIFLLVRMSASE